MFGVCDEGGLPGLADLVKAKAAGLTSEAAVAECERAIVESELPVGVTMSVISDMRQFIERILFRKFVRELPAESRKLPWFECHVPPGGTTTVVSSSKTTRSSSLKLNIFGAGLGRGRKTSISISDTSEPRTRCATFALEIEVLPRIYEIRGVESVELEVVKVLGQSVVSHDGCPYCGRSIADVDKFMFMLHEYIDARADRVGLTRRSSVEIQDSTSLDVGLEFGAIPTKLKVSARTAGEWSYEVESSFPAGRLYHPYSRLAGVPLQTPMWATDRAAPA